LKALILAAGLGSRLMHETKDLPKALVQVSGKAILSYQLDALISNSIHNIIIVLGKKGSLIKDFTPGLVVNRVRNRKDLMAGDNLLKLVKKFLEVEVTYLGYIIESDRVRDSIDEMIPFLIKDPQSKPSENLQQIIGALTNTDLQFVKREGRIFVSKQVRLSSGWEA